MTTTPDYFIPAGSVRLLPFGNQTVYTPAGYERQEEDAGSLAAFGELFIAWMDTLSNTLPATGAAWDNGSIPTINETGIYPAPTFSTVTTTALTATGTATVATLSAPTITTVANLTIAPPSSSNVINFKQTAAGTSIVQIGGTGGTSGNVSVQTQLALSGRTWSGTSISANAALFENATWTGSTGTNADAYLHMLQVTESIDAGAGGGVHVLYLHDTTTGTTWGGNRSPLVVVVDIATAPTAGSGGAYTAITPKVNGSVNVGGVANVRGSTFGAAFGDNPVAHLGPSATFWSAVVGSEINTWTEAGCSVLDRVGLQVVDIDSGGGTSGVRGASDDVAFSMNNQYAPAAARGFKTGIGFGRAGGFFPVATTGTMIGAQGNLGSTFTVANGIDWSLGTATGNWLQFGSVFAVDGSGNANTTGVYKVSATQVLGARSTGWSAMTGSTNKATVYDTSTVTLAQLAGRVMALQAALTTHGMIGT